MSTYTYFRRLCFRPFELVYWPVWLVNWIFFFFLLAVAQCAEIFRKTKVADFWWSVIYGMYFASLAKFQFSEICTEL